MLSSLRHSSEKREASEINFSGRDAALGEGVAHVRLAVSNDERNINSQG